MKDLIIIGASGFGREVAWLVERTNKAGASWNLLGFLDDNAEIQGIQVNGYDVLGTVDDANKYPDACFVCAVGAAQTREKIINRVKEIKPDIEFATVIDPSVEMSGFVKIGEGTIICGHTVLTVNIDIGNHVIINLDCTIGHDAVIRDFATLYPSVNISGMANIGYCSELGTGMQIIQGKTVGDYAIVGAGAVVVRDIPDRCTAVGSPAKPKKFLECGDQS